MQSTPDGILIERMARGDHAALQHLYGRHGVRVFRFVTRLVRDEALAEDIVEEVFFDVWRSAGKFEGRSEVSTWILGIARNKAYSSLRKTRDDLLDEGVAESILDEADDPELRLQKVSKAEAIRMCIDKLSADHRETIDLVYYHEKSVEEVAAIVGIPEATVKTRMFYARKQLAKLLEAAGIDRGWP